MDREILKSGTTTVAIVCKDGVVLSADKRATSGYLVAHKKFDKVVPIADTIAVTTAGVVSDVQLLVKLIKAELKLKTIRTGKAIYVKEAVNLLSVFVYNNIRKLTLIPGISHFIVGGKDASGFYVYDLSADGSIAEIDDYVSSGSGSVIAYGVLEALYNKNLNVDEGIKLAVKSINSAVQRDIATGNGIDVVTITKDCMKKVFSKEISYKVEI